MTKLIIELFCLVSREKDLHNTFKSQINRLVAFITTLPKDFEDREGLKRKLKSAVSNLHPLYNYF
jgi:hypothetical protein